MTKLKSLPSNVTEFDANGHKYYVAKSIAPIRYKEYEKLLPSISFGLTFQSIYSNLSKLYAHLNAQHFADASVVCHNLMSGIRNIDDENRVHPSMLMCALFINREGEDETKYDEAFMLEKINDWMAEGYDYGSFFHFAISGINGFRDALIASTNDLLQSMEDKK